MTYQTVEHYVGDRLREKRQRLGLSLEKLALKLDVSFQQLQKYEKGQTKIPASTLFRLSQLLQVPIGYFFDGFVDEADQEAAHRTPDIIQQEPRKELNVLIVEDDPDDDYLIRKALEDYDLSLNLHTVHDGEKALELLKQKKTSSLFPSPNLILLDLSLPKFDGHMLLRAIKKNPALAEISVVILTNSISHPEMTQTYKNHASGYICKSFDFKAFKKSMHTVMDYWAKTVVLPISA